MHAFTTAADVAGRSLSGKHNSPFHRPSALTAKNSSSAPRLQVYSVSIPIRRVKPQFDEAEFVLPSGMSYEVVEDGSAGAPAKETSKRRHRDSVTRNAGRSGFNLRITPRLRTDYSTLCRHRSAGGSQL